MTAGSILVDAGDRNLDGNASPGSDLSRLLPFFR